MKTIRILHRTDARAPQYVRQLPQCKPVSLDGRYAFFFNEDGPEETDYVAVVGKGCRKACTCKVPRGHTLLLTSEPYSVLAYPHRYCAQFARVLSCQEELGVPQAVHTQAILPWFVGVEGHYGGAYKVNLTYDDFRSGKASCPEKTKLLSVITSNKTFTRGHRKRLKFVARLKEALGDQVDIFGSGIRPFDDKWSALAPYKYHLAIENTSERFYWTEKISDCFLSDTFPIYHGCTNILDFFPADSLRTFPLNDFDAALRIIADTIGSTAYEDSRSARAEAKRRVMDEYNFFTMIAQACDSLPEAAEAELVTLRPAEHFFNFHNLYVKHLSHAVGRLLGGRATNILK